MKDRGLIENFGGHFWKKGRNRALYNFMLRDSGLRRLFRSSAEMIELGCGLGDFAAFMGRQGIPIKGCDISEDWIAQCRKSNGADFTRADILDLGANPGYDLVFLLDVLEHIGDDLAALERVSGILKERGFLVLSVPVCKFMHGYFDRQAGHKRRYAKRELLKLLRRAGFRVEQSTYFMFILFPLLFLYRIFGNVFCSRCEGFYRGEMRVHPVLNKIFLGIIGLEGLLIRRFNLPYGTSLFVIARKSGTTAVH